MFKHQLFYNNYLTRIWLNAYNFDYLLKVKPDGRCIRFSHVAYPEIIENLVFNAEFTKNKPTKIADVLFQQSRAKFSIQWNCIAVFLIWYPDIRACTIGTYLRYLKSVGMCSSIRIMPLKSNIIFTFPISSVKCSIKCFVNSTIKAVFGGPYMVIDIERTNSVYDRWTIIIVS